MKDGSNKQATTGQSPLTQVKYLDTESGTFRRAERILTPPATQDISLVHGKFEFVATIKFLQKLTFSSHRT